mgnify:CR=1 FL=1|tara:strand:- start:1088 stop:1207 length:120 start_codon:yes stop_codon:yes gene_type:complete
MSEEEIFDMIGTIEILEMHLQKEKDEVRRLLNVIKEMRN